MNVELMPFTPGEEMFFTYNREEGNSCIGHMAGDFGSSGDRFFSNWKGRENDRNTPEFQAELHSAVFALRQDLLKDYETMEAYCLSHPEAMLDSGESYKRFGFKLETDTRQYFVNCFFGESTRDSRFIAYAYDKPAPVLEQAQPAFGIVQPGTAEDSEMYYRNDAKNNLCVGYLRGDFGKRGNEFWHNWFDSDGGRNTPEFKAEFQGIMNTLRQEVLKDLQSTQNYCYKHPEAQLPGDVHRYGFKVETESRQYFVRCTTVHDDYFYVYAYDKSAVREQEQPSEDKTSVLKKIREAEKTPKPPRKAKTSKKDKGEEEL